MKFAAFMEHSVKRCSPPKYTNYKKYRPFLAEDFSHRCAYCNLLDSNITTPFEIDHYIPKKVFKNIWDDLENTYENLIYSCKKCNNAKSAQFSGNIRPPHIENELFYNPSSINYNNIFYRNEYGAIDSDDPKGRSMISRLRLYRSIHNLAWISEQLNKIHLKLKKAINIEESPDRKKELQKADHLVCDYYIGLNQLFISSYNGKDSESLDFQSDFDIQV